MAGVPKVGKVKKILEKDLVPFTRQLSSMIGAGMSLMDSIVTIEHGIRNPEFRKCVVYMREQVEQGSALSVAMSAYPKIFDQMYVNMVIAGEQSGHFDGILRRLTTIIQDTASLRRKIKSALTYPKVVVSISLLIAGGLIQFVVPTFGNMFKDFGRPLPGLTQALLDIAEFVKAYWYIVLGVGAVVLFAFRKWVGTESGRLAWDGFKLRIPVFGELALKGAIARFSRLLGEMLNAGIPILKALEVVSGSLDNRVLEKSVLDARTEVEQGRQLNVALEGKPFMPDMMVRMIAAGERSGRMQDMLDSVATTYDEEVSVMIASLTALMEPFIMVAMGAIIGTIVIALFLPIFQLPSVAA